MVYLCCVPFCKSKSSDKSTSFHAFTKDIRLQKVWIHKIRRDTRKSKWNKRPFTVNKHVKICSKHFIKADFIIRSPTRKVLKKTAIPSVFTWSPKSTRQGHIKRNTNNEVIEQNSTETTRNCNTEVQLQTVVNSAVVVLNIAAEADLDIDNLCEDVTSTNPNQTKEIFDFKKMYFDLLIDHNKQSTISTIETSEKNPVMKEINFIGTFFSVERFMHDDKNFSYYTGFVNYNIFKISLGLLFQNSQIQNIKMKYSKNEKNLATKLSPVNQYFLTLVKLRQDFGYEHLHFLFDISVGTVSHIFTSWINFLYLRLASFDIWPHRNILIQKYPTEFLNKYPNVIGFIDVTEFYIQTPSSLVKQSQTYSQYKSHNTVKGLIITDENGAVIFVSALFTGSISDNELLLQSGFLSIVKEKLKCTYLSPGDIFLADKGFRTKDLLENIEININIPVFRITGTQFTADEVVATRTIAHERVHVERAIRRIKCYKILTDEAPITLMGRFNQIYTVCALLSNFRLPLRS